MPSRYDNSRESEFDDEDDGMSGSKAQKAWIAVSADVLDQLSNKISLIKDMDIGDCLTLLECLDGAMSLYFQARTLDNHVKLENDRFVGQ
jgi:hypothetical protein